MKQKFRERDGMEKIQVALKCWVRASAYSDWHTFHIDFLSFPFHILSFSLSSFSVLSLFPFIFPHIHAHAMDFIDIMYLYTMWIFASFILSFLSFLYSLFYSATLTYHISHICLSHRFYCAYLPVVTAPSGTILSILYGS